MKRFAFVAACVVALPGCLATAGVQVGNTGMSATQPSVGPGGSFSSGGVGAHFSDTSAAGALIGIGVLGTLFGRGDPRREPEPDPSRSIHEQDCTKPISDPAANLRCR